MTRCATFLTLLFASCATTTNPNPSTTSQNQPPLAQDLPDQLKPSDIQRRMATIKGPVQDCYAEYNVPGMVNINFTIEPVGKVSSAEAEGDFAGTPTGNCIVAAVKTVSFPPFKGAAMTGISYPFLLAK
jgi:hypothetical protein